MIMKSLGGGLDRRDYGKNPHGLEVMVGEPPDQDPRIQITAVYWR